MASTVNVPTPGADGVRRVQLGKKKCELCECYIVSGELDAAAVADDSKLLEVDLVFNEDSWFHGACYDRYWRIEEKNARKLISYVSVHGADAAFTSAAQRIYSASIMALCDIKRELSVYPCPGITAIKGQSQRNVFESFKLKLSPTMPLQDPETREILRFSNTLPFGTTWVDTALHAKVLPCAQQYFSFVLKARVHCDIKDADAMLAALKAWRSFSPAGAVDSTRVFANIGRIHHAANPDDTATTIDFCALFTGLQSNEALNRLAHLWMGGDHSIAYTAVSRNPTAITQRFIANKTRMLLPLPTADGSGDDPADTDHEQLSCVHMYLSQLQAHLSGIRATHKVSFDFSIEPIVRTSTSGHELSLFANARVQLQKNDYVFVCKVDDDGIIETARLALLTTAVPGSHAPWLIPELGSEFTRRLEAEYRCEVGVPLAS